MRKEVGWTHIGLALTLSSKKNPFTIFWPNTISNEELHLLGRDVHRGRSNPTGDEWLGHVCHMPPALVPRTAAGKEEQIGEGQEKENHKEQLTSIT